MAFSFGEFILDPQTGALTGPDGHMAVRRQTFRLPQVLLEHAPELMDRLAPHAVSYGGFRAPYALAVEKRFRTAIILSAGVFPIQRIPAEVQLQDYPPRTELPLLLINGRDDFNFPHDDSQLPFFELLGTPEDRKRHLVLDWGHLPTQYSDVIRAYLLWSGRWLGKVDESG